MKSGLKWMVLVVVALVSTNAWAIWNPDTDAGLVFYMNFNDGYYDNDARTATAVKPVGLVGTLVDYNTVTPNVFGETSAAGLGKDANFAAMHDNAPGPGVASSISAPNDVKLTVPSITLPNGTGVFDFGDGYTTDANRTWTFWFNVPYLDQGTMIRHADAQLTTAGHENLVWEIRIFAGKLQFYHKGNCLRMETASTMSQLGVDVNTWHHAAVVIDRSNAVETSVPTTQLSPKIYVDGLEVPIIVTYLNNENMNVDLYFGSYGSPLWIGAGEREFDGLLDDVRLFNRDLTALEVSILNQPDSTKPRALLPIPRSSNVVISTGVSWEPAASMTAQTLYFGTATDANLLPSKPSTGNQASNAQLGGPLALGKKYYWYIRSTIGGNDVNGPLWSFNTETGKAINPSPRDGEQDVDVCDVNLLWSTPTAATTYTVYASAIRKQVEDSNAIVQIYSGSNPYFMGYDPCLQGATIYWRVNSTYPSSGTIAGDIWSFRTNAYEIVFNTDDAETTYADHIIPAYTCLLHSDGWSDDPCATATLASDGVAVFNFPNGFNYDKRYDIIVVPQVRPEWVDTNTPTPLAIHVTGGNFYFDGRVQIAGDDILTTSQDLTFARSGGFPGPKHNQNESVFSTGTQPALADYWTEYLYNPADTGVIFHTRFNNTTANSSTAHSIYEPTANAKRTFGPGVPVNPPYKNGGGGGAGGVGGDSGRGYFHGVFSGGPSYGDEEVPVPFGGSAGGWGGGSSPGGAAGGGGIEIYASGNVTLDVNSQILAHGGGQLCGPIGYPAGGGGGGSVRIIAGGSVTNKGIIDVNGGKGGDGSQGNSLGGGGGGGRVAIFYGTTKDLDNGKIAANGGLRGAWYADPCAIAFGLPFGGLAQNGQNGTIFVTQRGTPDLAKKASAPTPANDNKMVYYNPTDACNIQLKWYSGYGGTNDVVYWGTTSNPATQLGASVPATRGQHSSTATLAISADQTYYWKVVTDGTVSSDIWSFTTVDWQCPLAAPGGYPHSGGLEWDSNHDCVIDYEDFDFFANDWLNPEFGGYRLEFVDFNRFATEWRQCFNRTDGGCDGL
jgi:hypothetical protein